jgi:hypothetical protein
MRKRCTMGQINDCIDNESLDDIMEYVHLLQSASYRECTARHSKSYGSKEKAETAYEQQAYIKNQISKKLERFRCR